MTRSLLLFEGYCRVFVGRPLWRVDGPVVTTQVKLHYDRRSVGQSVLVSGTHLGPAHQFFPSFEVEVRSYFTTDSMSWYRAPLWDLRPDITSCRNVAVWNLRSCIYGAPSLWSRDSYITLWDHAMSRGVQRKKSDKIYTNVDLWRKLKWKWLLQIYPSYQFNETQRIITDEEIVKAIKCLPLALPVE
jgi:hypothetical protein